MLIRGLSETTPWVMKHRQGRQDKRNRERENTTNRKEGRDKLPILTPRVTISACSGETSTFTRRDFIVDAPKNYVAAVSATG